MNSLRPLTSAEKAEVLALIERVLASFRPTNAPKDDYYRDVLERMAKSFEGVGVVEVAPYMVKKQVLETAEEHAERRVRPPAA